MAERVTPRRPHKFNDLSGQSFVRLTAIEQVRDDRGSLVWRCSCICGGEARVRAYRLKSGHTKSCGCIAREAAVINGRKATKHGLTSGGVIASEYTVWRGMLARCYYPASPSFARYGAKGIAVCDRWRRSFAVFYEDVGPRPSLQHTLDRLDNSRGYSPDNCRWATRREQANNKTTNRRIAWGDREMTLREWADVLGLRYGMLLQRFAKGWPPERAFTEPRRVVAQHGSGRRPVGA